MQEPSVDRRAGLVALAAVAGVVLVGVLVTWAASIGPSGTLSGPGPEAFHITPTETPSESPSELRLRYDIQDDMEKRPYEDHPWVRVLAYVLEGLVVAVLLFLLVRWVRRRLENWRARQRPEADDPEIAFDVLSAPSRVADKVRSDADAQLAALRDGSPRNGIVACWHRFEVQAADAGLAPYAWETSSEFTLRVLGLAGADTRAVTELAALYREARFSTHELDEATRARAVETLRAVHAGWGRVSS